MKYFLFSPIGMTDPIRNNFDGPFLHIVRHYLPAKAVLFFTKETWDRHLSDDRYCALAKKIAPNMQIEPLNHSEIEQAHVFEIYDEHFRAALEKLHQEALADDDDVEILVNISSGTPQMEASLYLLAATVPFHVTPIQVATPEKRANTDHPARNVSFDVENEWENLFDNLEDSSIGNRCSPIHLRSVRTAILKENILSLVRNYDYSGAEQMLQNASELFTEEDHSLILCGKYRMNMQYGDARKEIAKLGLNASEIFEVQTADCSNVYEYISVMGVLLEHQDYINFARSVSPVLTDLLELVLRKVFNKNPEKWYSGTFGGIKKLSKFKLQADGQHDLIAALDAAFSGDYSDAAPSAANLLILLDRLNQTQPNSRAHIRDFEDLRNFESKIRNIAAHEIISITDDKISNLTGLTTSKVLEKLRNIFCDCIGRSLKWDSYEKLNHRIKERFQ